MELETRKAYIRLSKRAIGAVLSLLALFLLVAFTGGLVLEGPRLYFLYVFANFNIELYLRLHFTVMLLAFYLSLIVWVLKRGVRLLFGKNWSIEKAGKVKYFFPIRWPLLIFVTYIALAAVFAFIRIKRL